MSTANYNRIYSTMFEGSLYGKGALMIACWAYVLAEMKPDFGKSQFYVELNPEKVAHALGESPEMVCATIGRFCGPDEQSRSDEGGGRRLVREGQFTYLVVNGAVYNDIKRREAKREANRVAQQRRRASLKNGTQLPGEALAAKALDQNHEDAIVTASLPEPLTDPVVDEIKRILETEDENPL